MSDKGDARRRRGPVRDELVGDVGALTRQVEADLVVRLGTPDPFETARTPLLVELFSWYVGCLLDRWAEGAALTTADVARARRAGAELARVEVAPGRISRLWRLAPCAVVEQVGRVSAGRLGTSDFVALADRALQSSGRLGEVFSIAYRAETARLSRIVPTARARVLSELITGDQPSWSAIAERSAAIGLELPAHPVVIAVVTDLDTMAAPSRIQLDEIVGPGPDRAEGAQVPEAPGVVLAPESALPRLAVLIEERGWWAAASRVPAWADGTQVFQATRSALRDAPRWAFLDRAVLQDSDVAALEVVSAASKQRSAALAEAVLGVLLDEEQAPLLAAVEAHLAFGSTPAAARSLGIQPHALRRRLMDARELTGRDVRSVWDRFVLGLATTVLPGQA